MGEEEECVKETAHSSVEGELREESGHRSQGRRDSTAWASKSQVGVGGDGEGKEGEAGVSTWAGQDKCT